MTAEQMQDELRTKLKKKNLEQYEIDMTNFPRKCVMCGNDDHDKYANIICALDVVMKYCVSH